MKIFTWKDNLAVAIIIIFGIWILPGCTPALAKCRNWSAIEKERQEANFQCLSESEDGWRCNRARWHYFRHHSHSLESDCISWR